MPKVPGKLTLTWMVCGMLCNGVIVLWLGCLGVFWLIFDFMGVARENCLRDEDGFETSCF
jgi:hypothetical protein